MLSKIACSLFKYGQILFHPGLNIILGDDDAKNSIGKSSALMVIDFAMGGDSLMEDKAGVIRSLGQHAYKIEFVFDGDFYYFKRSTNESLSVYICNADYEPTDVITLDAYREKLKILYGLEHLNSSFRSVVGPFSRIWNKGSIDPNQPFSGDIKEPAGTAIARLIDLFERTDDIVEEKAILEEKNERKKIIAKSMSADIIPKINKAQYKLNESKIAENNSAIQGLKQGFAGALSAYEALFDENLRALHQQKNELVLRRSELLEKIDRLKRDLLGLTPRLSANIALVMEFFPEVNVERLEKVEAFHQNIGKIVQKELKSELAVFLKQEAVFSAEINKLESTIRNGLASKGTPDDLFARVFELKEVTDKAVEENKFYDKKASIDQDAKSSKDRLDAIYVSIFSTIEAELNLKLKRFNKVVYGPSRHASQIRIKSANSYSFISPVDTGTGKSYAGLIGFDLAMLSLTCLPFVIHDSVIYKNIEVPATRNIIRILAAVKRKQVFLAFDEAAKFGARAESLLRTLCVLKLGHSDLLYTKDWRSTTKE